MSLLFSFSGNSFAQKIYYGQAVCATMVNQLARSANAVRGKQVAFQMTQNKSWRDREFGTISVSDGHLIEYDPDDFPDTAALINRSAEGAFYPSSTSFIGSKFTYDELNGSHFSSGAWPIVRKDEITVVLLENRFGKGRMFLILESWGPTALPVRLTSCFSDVNANVYLTGVVKESSGTSVLSFVFNVVTPQ